MDISNIKLILYNLIKILNHFWDSILKTFGFLYTTGIGFMIGLYDYPGLYPSRGYFFFFYSFFCLWIYNPNPYSSCCLFLKFIY